MKIFFFDIDGTLASHGKIPESALYSLYKLKEKGYLTFISTGRPAFYAQELFGNLVSGCVACNGCLGVLGKEILYERPLDVDKMLELGAFVESMGGEFMLSGDQYVYNPSERPDWKRQYGEHFKTELMPINYHVFDISYENVKDKQALFDKLEKVFILNDHKAIKSADCTLLDFTKGDGIKEIQKCFGVDKEDCYSFGDGKNDLSMFRETGHRIAMGNAVEELKKEASYVTSDIFDDGIYKALVKLGIIEDDYQKES